MNWKQLEAGMFSPAVFICLIGGNGYSGRLCVQSHNMSMHFGKTIHQDTLDNMIIESSRDLGKISVVILGIDHSNFPYSWYVNEVGLYNYQSKKMDAFPCYHWVRDGDNVSIVAQTGN